MTVVTAQSGDFGGLTFTPNGDYVYYTHSDPDDDKLANLYSVPSLGGSPKLISTDVDGAVARAEVCFFRHRWLVRLVFRRSVVVFRRLP